MHLLRAFYFKYIKFMKAYNSQKPELMAPAGDWTMLRTAVQAGANAVYFGVDKFNMRAKAANFTVDELPEIVKFAKKMKLILTLQLIQLFLRKK